MRPVKPIFMNRFFFFVFSISFGFSSHALSDDSGVATGNCGCLKNGQPINWHGACDHADMVAHGCDGSGGDSGGGDSGSAGVSQAGAAIGQALIHELLGPSDEEKEQKRQQELKQQQIEDDREAQKRAEEKAEQDRQDNGKLNHLHHKLKGVGFLGKEFGAGLRQNDGGDDNGNGVAHQPGHLKLKHVDEPEVPQSQETTSAEVTVPEKQKHLKNEQVIAETDGCILMKLPIREGEDKVVIENANSYPVDVDVYMSIPTNCNHSFKDVTIQPGQTIEVGWVAQNNVNDPWSYTVGMNVAHHNSNGFNYAH